MVGRKTLARYVFGLCIGDFFTSSSIDHGILLSTIAIDKAKNQVKCLHYINVINSIMFK